MLNCSRDKEELLKALRIVALFTLFILLFCTFTAVSIGTASKDPIMYGGSPISVYLNTYMVRDPIKGINVTIHLEDKCQVSIKLREVTIVCSAAEPTASR